MSNEMKPQTSVSANTLINKVKHHTNLTIDWTGMETADLQALAQRSIVIRYQNANRTKERIPNGNETIKAVDYRIGVRLVEKEDIGTLLAKLTPEERAAVLAKYLTGEMSPNA